jgi:long-chain acyl-CoA synthetase
MPSVERRAVLTGATGFLGAELVSHLLRTEPHTRLVLLIRERDDAGAKARGDKLLAQGFEGAELEEARRRVEVVRGDLEADRLGMEARTYDRIANEATEIIHGAASVSFDLPLAQARAINVEGTRRVLDLARATKARVSYIGTAYVAGDRREVVLENDLDKGQSFRNTYERTKMEAEKIVHERLGEQAITIFRPSIIVGDSTTGKTSSFKVMYWPLKMFARGWAWLATGRRQTPIDLVPVDYVVRALAHIRNEPGAIGQVHHLAAGPENTATLGELSQLAADFFRRRPPIFLPPRVFAALVRPLITLFVFGKFRRLWRTAYLYLPYLALEVQFDTTNARKALAGTDIQLPRVDDYFSRLLHYCVESDWGKKAPGEPPTAPPR